MKKISTLFIALACLYQPVLAQLTQATGILDINNIRCHATSTGDLFNPFGTESLPGFEVPAGSGIRSIYAANLWVGGLTPNQALKFAGETYQAEGTDWFPGPLTNDGSASISEEDMLFYDRVWVANQADVETHIAYFTAVVEGNADELFPDGYTTPDWFFDWPAHGNTAAGQDYYLAPFYDFPGVGSIPGMYDPEHGDYPMFCGEKCLYFIMNDKGNVHTESGGEAIGLEIHGMLYGFNSAESEMLNNTVFLKYRIINQGTYTLADTYISLWADFDLGNPMDDYVGCDVERSAFYVYNGDDFDDEVSISPGYGAATPRVAVQFLTGPYMDPDQTDNELPGELGMGDTYGPFSDGFESLIMDDERLGMSSFLYYNLGSNPINGDPILPFDYYNYMRRTWKNEQEMFYGGNGVSGNGVTDTPAHYMFPGDSDPLNVGTGSVDMDPWTEVSAGNVPSDRRGVGSAGPFTLHPGEENFMEVAFVFADETGSGLGEEEFMQNRLDEVREFYQYIGDYCYMDDFIPLSHPELQDNAQVRIYPQPARDNVNVVFGKSHDRIVFRLLDASGRVILASQTPGGVFTIDTSSVSDGIYFIELTDGNKKAIQKMILNH